MCDSRGKKHQKPPELNPHPKVQELRCHILGLPVMPSKWCPKPSPARTVSSSFSLAVFFAGSQEGMSGLWGHSISHSLPRFSKCPMPVQPWFQIGANGCRNHPLYLMTCWFSAGNEEMTPIDHPSYGSLKRTPRFILSFHAGHMTQNSPERKPQGMVYRLYRGHSISHSLHLS